MNVQRTAVITGAASGMGHATVQKFLDGGWHVIGVDINQVTVERTGGGRFDSVVADVRNKDEIRDAIAAVTGPNAQIHAVANIAGVYPPTTLADYDEATYRRIFDINVYGVANVIAACEPSMPEGSAVVNFASVDAFVVSPGQLFYGASKAAVVMLTKTLALELAPKGIRVNGIAPGWVATPGNAATGRMEAAAASIPLGRVANPDEIAGWAWLLSQPESVSFMTGETVVLSGGDVIR
ncbi:MAG: SDR family NAD(P)-dependent oxidoreductase [Pseudoclavibacter sp.]